jgi:protein-S-isoprenylcysteine O-methyltransferase Ste14
MALVQSFEKQGNFLFKYRGQFPVLLFILSVPFICLTDYTLINYKEHNLFMFTAILISVLGFLVRFYTIGTTPKGTSGRNTKEQVADVLNSSGMYSMVRHPLYLGNYLIWLGISLASFNIYFVVIMSLLFWIYYERIMFAEERFLERKFGEDYLNWASKLPAFLPSILNFKESDTKFSIITVLRREYASVLAAVVGFTFIEVLRTYFSTNNWSISDCTAVMLVGTIVLVLILRSLKHYTSILVEKGRS